METASLQTGESRPPRWRPIITFGLATAGACYAVAFFQLFGLSRDYPEYDAFFRLLRESGFEAGIATRFEIGFVAVSYLVSLITANNLSLYAILASASAFGKLAVARLLSKNITVAAVVAAFYATRYMPLHELAQIRVSLGLALLMVGFALRQSTHLALSIAACLGGVLFHWSLAILVPLILINMTTRRAIVVVSVAEFVGVYFILPVLVHHLSGTITVLQLYEELRITSPNPFAATVLLDIAAILMGVTLWRSSSEPMRRALVLEIAGIAFYYAALDYPAFAHRIREAFSVFWIPYVAMAIGRTRALTVGALSFVGASVVGYSYLFWFYTGGDPFFHF